MKKGRFELEIDNALPLHDSQLYHDYDQPTRSRTSKLSREISFTQLFSAQCNQYVELAHQCSNERNPQNFQTESERESQSKLRNSSLELNITLENAQDLIELQEGKEKETRQIISRDQLNSQQESEVSIPDIPDNQRRNKEGNEASSQSQSEDDIF